MWGRYYEVAYRYCSACYLHNSGENYHRINYRPVVINPENIPETVNNTRSDNLGMEWVFTKDRRNTTLNLVFFTDDFEDQVHRALNLPAHYSTIVVRAQLAQRIYEIAEEEIKKCGELVSEQLLIQRGCKCYFF